MDETSDEILDKIHRHAEACRPKTHADCEQRIAELEGERTTLAKALRVTYEAHQDIHPCTLCLEMWRRLEKLAALVPEGKAESRWHEGMREYQPGTCWRYVGPNDACILKRGHDGGEHEP